MILQNPEDNFLQTTKLYSLKVGFSSIIHSIELIVDFVYLGIIYMHINKHYLQCRCKKELKFDNGMSLMMDFLTGADRSSGCLYIPASCANSFFLLRFQLHTHMYIYIYILYIP